MPLPPSANVLVLIHDALQRDLLTLALKRHQLTPVAVDPQNGLATDFERTAPQAMIIDLHLPGTNSLELIRQLRQGGKLTRCGVMVISSMGFPEIIRQAIAAGADDFIVKPVDPDALIARLLRLMERKQGSAAL